MQEKRIMVKEKQKKIPLTPYLLLLPPLVVMIMFSFYPFIKTVISTFSITTEFGEFIRFYGLGNWERMLRDAELQERLIITLKFSGMCLTTSFLVAMLFAVFCSNIGKGSKVYQTLFGLPMVIATSSIAAIWVFVFRQNAGLLNIVLGTENAWLKESETALTTVAIVTAWSHVASNYLYLLVGFRNVSDDLIEASKIDGAGWWTRTIRIMIPMASPQIFYVLFLNIIWSLKTFTQLKLLTGGGPAGSTNTFMLDIYYKGTINGQFELACCEAVVLFIMIFIATRIQFAFENKMVHYQ